MNITELQQQRKVIERQRENAIANFDEQLETIDTVIEGLQKLKELSTGKPHVVKRGGGVVKESKKSHKAISGKKYCPKCEKEKSTDEFGKNKSTKDGLQTYCKPCTNAYAARKASGEQPAKILKPRYKPIGDPSRQGMLGAQPGGGLQRRCGTCNKVKPIGEFPEGSSDCTACHS